MADNVDVVRDAPRKPLPPVDQSVKIPDAVKRAAALAESFYQASPAPQPAPTPEPQPVPQAVQPQPEPAPQPQPQPEPPAQAQPEPPAQPQPEPPAQAQPEPPAQPENWQHRYQSMKGRFDQSQQTIGLMQDQMAQMGDEMIRMQRMIQQPQQQQQQQRPLLTDEDIQAYGPDMVNMIQRAAVQAVSPELEAVRAENNQLRQTVVNSQKSTIYQVLDAQIPDWRAINNDPRFKRWLSLPDIYSGQLRKTMLNAAFQAAAAPRVVAFFKGFLTEEAATGQLDSPAVGQQQVPIPAPRHAAVQLSSLAAPGRPSPTGGQSPTVADKPIYTRAQISDFYRSVQSGRFVGRETEKAQLEADIFAAQREGRIR